MSADLGHGLRPSARLDADAGTQPPASQISKGDILSLFNSGAAHHSMVVTQAGSTLSQVKVAYRSGICDGNGCPPNHTTLQNYLSTHNLTGYTWNLFHIIGFAK